MACARWPDSARPRRLSTKEVLPILQKNCQACHRPGEIAPMAFLTYSQTRPWAKAIKTAVAGRKMPPWFADPRYGHFSNDRRLSDADIATLAAWAMGMQRRGTRRTVRLPLPGPRVGTSNPTWFLKCPRLTPFRRRAPSSTPISPCPRDLPKIPGDRCRSSSRQSHGGTPDRKSVV